MGVHITIVLNGWRLIVIFSKTVSSLILIRGTKYHIQILHR